MVLKLVKTPISFLLFRSTYIIFCPLIFTYKKQSPSASKQKIFSSKKTNSCFGKLKYYKPLLGNNNNATIILTTLKDATKK